MKPNPSNNCNLWGELLSERTVAALTLTEVVYGSPMTTAKHWHEQAGFCLVLRGSYTENYGKKILRCAPQTVTFSPAGEKHQNHFHEAQSRCFVINLESVWLKRGRECRLKLDSPADFRNNSPVWLANRIYHEYNNSDEASPLVIEALILEMLVEVSRRGSTSDSKRQPPPRWLRQAEIFIREHFSEKFTLEAIASAVGVHPVYLASEFRRHYQYTVGESVRRLRIEYACRELTNGEIPLVEIALAAGFSNQSHFSSVFKRMTGMTPAIYRTTALKS